MAIEKHHIHKTKLSLGFIGLIALLLLVLTALIKTAPAAALPTLSAHAHILQDTHQTSLNGEAHVSMIITNQEGSTLAHEKVALLIADSDKRSSKYSQSGLYSVTGLEPFLTTDNNGKVSFTLKSQIRGDIKYQIILIETENDKPVLKTLPETVAVHFTD
jgi:hypothetical protein